MAGLATTLGSGAMTNAIGDIAEAEVLFVTGSNTTEAHPVLALQMKRAVMERGAKLILADPRRIELAQFAHLHLRQRPGTDVALANTMAHVILHEELHNPDFIAERTEGFEAFVASVSEWTPERGAQVTGIPAEDIIAAARLYATAERASIFWAMGITQHTTGTDNVKALVNLALLTGHIGRPGSGLNPLRGQNNVQGACDMGGLPNVYPGYQKVTDPAVQEKFAQAWGMATVDTDVGLTVTEIMDAILTGEVHALYIMGENPMLSDPDLNHVRQALEQVDFLVHQDIFLNETGAYADVVLPAASFAEKSGTFTNTERRVQLIRPALDPPGEARPDWQIITELANRMGASWRYDSPAEIMDEIAAVTPIYGGIAYKRLENNGGLQWPCPTPDHPGTPYLHKGRFTRGRGLFSAISFAEAKELPNEEYPFILSTGRVLYHWHGGTLSRRSPGLEELAPQAEIEIHPRDAEGIGVTEGQKVRVRSRRGELIARATVTRRSPPGTVFMTFHYAEAAANLLTHQEVDPIAKIPEYKVSAVQVEPLEEKIITHS